MSWIAARDTPAVLPPTPAWLQGKIRAASACIRSREHTFRAKMEHVLHAGVYARTARVAPGMAFTSVLIKIPTVVTVHGHCAVFAGEGWRELKGYNVLAALAGRMQAYVTFEETEITMIFATAAKTVEEAEMEFTDEAGELLSRREGNVCQA